jgi:hypothetical protein
VKALTWHEKAVCTLRGSSRSEDRASEGCDHQNYAWAICGSDLHIYGGIIPSMKRGDVLGHENMGEVVEVGPGAASGASSPPDRPDVPSASGG